MQIYPLTIEPGDTYGKERDRSDHPLTCTQEVGNSGLNKHVSHKRMYVALIRLMAFMLYEEVNPSKF